MSGCLSCFEPSRMMIWPWSMKIGPIASKPPGLALLVGLLPGPGADRELHPVLFSDLLLDRLAVLDRHIGMRFVVADLTQFWVYLVRLDTDHDCLPVHLERPVD